MFKNIFYDDISWNLVYLGTLTNPSFNSLTNNFLQNGHIYFKREAQIIFIWFNIICFKLIYQIMEKCFWEIFIPNYLQINDTLDHLRINCDIP